MGGASSRTNLHIHFEHHHVRDTIVILEEGNWPYPRCPQCNIFVPQKALNGRNLATEFCRRIMEKKWSLLAEEESWAGTERALTDYGALLSQVTSFKYLGRVIASDNNNCLSMVRNLRRARKKRSQLTRILSMEGEDDRTSGHIYLVVVQSVLLYGYWRRAWRRCWEDSITGWTVGWQDGKHGRGGTEAGFTPGWNMRWQRRICRRWRPTSPAAKKQLWNIFQLGLLWTYVWRRSRGQGQGW